MFGEMLGGKGYCGEQEWDWMKDLDEDLKAFGIKFEGWREVAQKVGRWFRRVEDGAEVFMRKWHTRMRRRQWQSDTGRLQPGL